MVVGDIHGKWGLTNLLIEREHPDMILQVGDFGWWPRMEGVCWKLKGLELGDARLHFCDGNHEDHPSLLEHSNQQTAPAELYKGVVYQPRGSTIQLPDGRTVLFMGGAYSIDGQYRTVGNDWFPVEELISQKDFSRLPDCKVDIVISHTCPSCMVPVRERYGTDSCEKALDAILDIYHPSLWYFGHWHTIAEGVEKGGCRWFCLNDIPNHGCWRWIS
jgi:hypothetical protein